MQETDKTWFDKELRVILASTAAWFKPKPSDVKRYWDAVQDYERTEVDAGLSRISAEHTSHFAPGELRAAVQVERSARLRKAEEAESAYKPFDYTEGTDAAYIECMKTLRGPSWKPPPEMLDKSVDTERVE